MNKNFTNMHHYDVFTVNVKQITFYFCDGSIVDFEQVNTSSESKYLIKVSNKVTKTMLKGMQMNHIYWENLVLTMVFTRLI